MGRSRTSTLLPLLLVLGAAAVVGPQLISRVDDLFDGGDPVLVGTGGTAFLVGSDGESEAKRCTSEQVVRERGCDDVKVVVIDAAKMPFIARNIKLAWQGGKPSILHRESVGSRAKRAKACGPSVFTRTLPFGSCDEYSFATSREGGEGSRIEQVHQDEQFCQGGTISSAYQYTPIDEGEAYIVVISHPDRIAEQAWAGQAATVDSC